MARTTLLRIAAAVLLCGGTLFADSTQAIERALGPYYAALVASSRGNIDATSRHLLLFASRWKTASREARTSPPRAIEQDPEWPAVLDQVNAAIERAREMVRVRDVAGAHAELEVIRSAIRDVRARHHALTFDDYLTDYHEAVERMIGHVAGRNEIRLTARDFAEADEDLRAALAAWQTVQASAGPLAGQPGWAAAAREASAALDQAQRAIAAKNATSAGRSAERVKTTYYDLLLAVSKARG
jgi:hypothetical protein